MTVMTGDLGAVALTDTVDVDPTDVEVPAEILASVRNWNITESISDLNYKASGTRRGTARLDGLYSWSGSFLINGGKPPVMPRDEFKFWGFTGGAATGPRYNGIARCDSISLTWDWTSAAIISTTVNFTGYNSVVLENTGAAIIDNLDPNVPQVCAAAVQMFGNIDELDDPDFNDDALTGKLMDVTNITLTITADNQTYSNSGTTVTSPGGRKYCTQKSLPGIIDWTLAIARERAEWGSLAAEGVIPLAAEVGTNKCFRLWVNEDEHWTFEWGKILEHSGLTVDIETSAIIGYTKNVAMNNVWVGSLRSPAVPDIETPPGGSVAAIVPPSLGRIWKPGDTGQLANIDNPWFPLNLGT